MNSNMSGGESDPEYSPTNPKAPLEYMTIREIINELGTEVSINKVNVYGVITWLSDKKKSLQQVTIVDPTCGPSDRLKLNVFTDSAERTVGASCEIGDIVRFHRLKVQMYNGHPQGVHFNKGSSWIRFKRHFRTVTSPSKRRSADASPTTSRNADSQHQRSDEFDFVGNKSGNTFNEQDKKKVSELRKWLDTNPQLNALLEAHISTQGVADSTAPQLDTTATTTRNLASISAAVVSANEQVQCSPIRFTEINHDGFYDVVCQVCAIGVHDAIRYLLVWDSTNSKHSFCVEREFKLAKECVLFAPELLSYLFQVFVYDDYVLQCDALKPGDYVLLKNMQVKSIKVNSQTDMVMKMPGNTPSARKYGRTVMKLNVPSSILDLEDTPKSENEIDNRIREIARKGKELKLVMVSEADFMREYNKLMPVSQDINSTLSELINLNNQAQQTRQASAPAQVSNVLAQANNLLEDDPNAYRKRRSLSPKKGSPSKSPQKRVKNMSADTDVVLAIDEDILKLKRLVKMTYLVPYMMPKSASHLLLVMEPYFHSLNSLAEQAAKHDYMRCKVQAKLFSYSIQTCPLASVFVCCKHCGYVNFVPFHLAHTYQSASLNHILRQQQQETESQQVDENENNGDELEGMRKRARNFSLEWLNTAMPILTHVLDPTQTASASEARETTAYEYSCPRCEYASNSSSRSTRDDTAAAEPRQLDYIYRFWFVLRDQHSQLAPCLLEGDMAASFLGDLAPIIHFTSQKKSQKVYSHIHERFNRKYLFTLETFKLAENSNETLPRPNVLYRIVDLIEIVN